MPITYASNLAAFKIVQKFNAHSERLGGLYGQVSTGDRLFNPREDPGGSALSAVIRGQAATYKQAKSNTTQGEEAIDLASRAVDALTTIATQIQELAMQAANSAPSSAQRSALDAEAQALKDEFERIRSSTKYNNIYLLDGSRSDTRFQAGYGSAESIKVALGAYSGSSTITVTIDGSTSGVGDGTFKAPYSLNSTGFATDPAAHIEFADVDGDSNIDIIELIGNAGDELFVFRGNGDGTFKAGVSYVTTVQGYDFKYADMNSDGIKDVVIAGGGVATAVSILHGNANGTFKAAVTYAIGFTPGYLDVADINGDGYRDIVTGGFGNGKYAVRLGNSSGTFTAPISYATGGTAGLDIRLVDINSDSKLDIVYTVENSDGIRVYLGNGDGTFKATYSSNVTYDSRGGNAVGDIDGDGDLDIVVGTNEAGTNAYSVYLGNNDGTFKAEVAITSPSEESGPLLIDINGDSKLDLITGDDATDKFFIRFGNGDGTFKASTSFYSPIINTTETPAAIGVYDVNEDGIKDVVTLNSRQVWISLGNGTGSSSSSSTSYTISSSTVPTLSYVNLEEVDTSLLTYSAVNQTIDALTVESGNLTAGLSRLQIATRNLESRALLLENADAKIRDVDFATALAEIIRLNILTNTTQALLASANLQPEQVLKLLTG